MKLNYSNEVVGSLLAGDLHVRAIARKLGGNHMTVARRLKGLIDENVVDVREEGRNKVYFLKRTPEARSRVIMAECDRLHTTLERYPILRNIIERVQQKETVRLALLFGSYAKGTTTGRSDIDLFVETRDRKMKRELELLHSKLNVKIGSFNTSTPLGREIVKHHVIIKGIELFYDRTAFFYQAP